MSYSESSGWKKSWVVGAIALVAIAFGTARSWRSIRPAPKGEGLMDQMIQSLPVDPTSRALAEQGAAEAVRILGSGGGRVVLVVPVPKPLHHMTQGIAYETGVRDGLRNHPTVELEGIYFAAPPYTGNEHQDERTPNLIRLQDIRQTHPNADVIVSFIGLPQLSPEEQKIWLDEKPPRMIVVEPWPTENAQEIREAIEKGLVEAVVLNAAPKKPEELLPPPGEEGHVAPTPQFNVVRRP